VQGKMGQIEETNACISSKDETARLGDEDMGHFPSRLDDETKIKRIGYKPDFIILFSLQI